jgi:prophage tail gpP-like protein
MSDLELRINRYRYSGWKTLRVTRSIEQFAHSYRVTLTDKWNEGASPIPIVAGDEVVLFIGNTRISTGYVDEDGLSYDDTSRTLTFSGRSKTCDLVDCAAIHHPGSWRNTGLLTIANDIFAPFSIDVRTNTTTGEKFRKFAIEEGETAFECISRAARERGLLMLTDAYGDLVFDRAGSSRVATVIERGVNIKRGSKKNSHRERFSKYIVKAQSPGTDEGGGKSTSLKRSSTDKDVSRYRPTIILADNESSGTELQKRADWERNVRSGRAKRLTYTLAEWEHADGLWEPNTLIRVIDPDARVDDELLAVSVTQSRDDQGSLTTIELAAKEAFDVEPLPRKKKGSL